MIAGQSSFSGCDFFLYTGECLSGALQWKELMQIATDRGFVPPVLIKSTIITCVDADLKTLAGNHLFVLLLLFSASSS